jgi:hypothetical protein
VTAITHARALPQLTTRTRRHILGAWIPAMFAGEAIGFTVPAAAGALVYGVGIPAWPALPLHVAAGGFEGAVLAFAQSLVLRRYIAGIDGRAWIRNTTVAAIFAWLLGMLPSTIGAPLFDHVVWFIPLISLGALVLLNAIGVAQWLVLRRHVDRAWWWIPGNAAAWILGIAWVFVAMAFVNEADPTWAIALAGVAGGVLMAATVSAVTGLALTAILRIDIRSPSPSSSA